MNYQSFISEQNLHEHIRTTSTFDVAQILPHTETAAEIYLYKYLGLPFLTAIVDGTVTNVTVVKQTKAALICFAGAVYSQVGLLNMSSSGIQEVGDTEAKPVRLEVLRNFEIACIRAGNAKLELLLEYLELNANTDGLELWKNSPTYAALQSVPIHSVLEFQKYVFIHNSRVAFLAIMPYIKRAYTIDLSDYVETVNSLQATYKTKAMNFLAYAICNMAYANALSDLSLVLGDSVLELDNTGSNRQTASYVAAKENRIATIRQEKMTYVEFLKDKLDKLIASVLNPTEVAKPFENQIDSHVYFVG